jgi:cytidylate kinase
MASIVIVTGSPGTGKTTLAAYLSKSHARGLHIPSDIFYTFPVHPISPYRSEAHEQNADIIVAVTHTAVIFAGRGYEVFLDGIFGPWFLPMMAAELRPSRLPVHYVVLRAPLEIALRRVQDRIGHERDHVVRQMHAAFANLGRYAGHTLDSQGRVEEVAAEFARRHAGGEFLLDLNVTPSKGAA